MGSGKSTVGALLARRLGWEFVDVDAAIEAREGCTVAAIFADHGESRFRALEADALRGLGARRRVVIATGGGAPAQPANRPFFSAADTAVVHLHVDLDTAIERSARGGGLCSRPMLARDGEAVRRLYDERLPRYRELGVEVTTAGKTPEDVAEEIVRLLEPLSA
jgi:shikimate kinase